jgi:ATP-dependent Clp protease adapter protein ClpS
VGTSHPFFLAANSESKASCDIMDETRVGYLRLLNAKGTPVLVHWSFPVGGLLISAFVGFDIWETAFFTLGYVLLIAIHEAGHAAAARRLGLKVFAIYISAASGECRSEPPQTVRGAFFLWSAGLIAQTALFLGSVLYMQIIGQPTSRLARCLILVFTVVNAILFFINVVPEKFPRGLPSDGYVLWKLLLHVLGNKPSPVPYGVAAPDKAPVFPPDTRLLTIKELIPLGFLAGVEILNDKTTPMEFVVTTLMRHLDLDRESSLSLMLAIHNKGGALVPLPSIQRAEAVAAAIVADAAASGHSLICRPVDAQQSIPADAIDSLGRG